MSSLDRAVGEKGAFEQAMPLSRRAVLCETVFEANCVQGYVGQEERKSLGGSVERLSMKEKVSMMNAKGLEVEKKRRSERKSRASETGIKRKEMLKKKKLERRRNAWGVMHRIPLLMLSTNSTEGCQVRI